MQTREQGDKFEWLAWSWLEAQGYSLLGKNYVRRIGEIDLIVRAPDQLTIVFVEVRYRSTEQFGGGVESVDFRKRKKLVRTANSWLQKYADQATPARIDLIAIMPASLATPKETCWQGFAINWIENAVEE